MHAEQIGELFDPFEMLIDRVEIGPHVASSRMIVGDERSTVRVDRVDVTHAAHFQILVQCLFCKIVTFVRENIELEIKR